MKVPRREFLRLLAAALPVTSLIASAQAYPTRPVRIIFGFPPGGGSDAIARLMGQWLSERLGQPFVIENRPGNVTNMATEAVVRAPADGVRFFWPLRRTRLTRRSTRTLSSISFGILRQSRALAA